MDDLIAKYGPNIANRRAYGIEWSQEVLGNGSTYAMSVANPHNAKRRVYLVNDNVVRYTTIVTDPNAGFFLLPGEDTIWGLYPVDNPVGWQASCADAISANCKNPEGYAIPGLLRLGYRRKDNLERRKRRRLRL